MWWWRTWVLPFLVGQKKNNLPDHNNHRGEDFFATSAHESHEMPEVILCLLLIGSTGRWSKQQLCIIMTLGGHLHHDHRLRAIDRGNGSPTDCSWLGEIWLIVGFLPERFNGTWNTTNTAKKRAPEFEACLSVHRMETWKALWGCGVSMSWFGNDFSSNSQESLQSLFSL